MPATSRCFAPIVRARRCCSLVTPSRQRVRSSLATGWASELGPTAPARTRDLPAIRATGGDDELADDEAARAARLPTIGLADGEGRAAVGTGADPGATAGLPSCARVRISAGARRNARTARARSSRVGEDAPPVCRWCGVIGDRVALPALRGLDAARGRRRARGAPRRSSAACSRRTGQDLGWRQGPRAGDRPAGARRRDARRRAARRRRLRRRRSCWTAG